MQQPTCTNIRIRSTLDAHKIFYGVYLGILPMVHRRLDADERLALHSGCVYVWEERGPHTELTGLGIERFTEGRRWSPSRVRDEFLFYYEKYTLPGDGQNSRTSEVHPPSTWDPLVKQTYSVSVETSKGLRKWHLTAYFTQATVDQLSTVDDIQDVGTAVVPEGMFRSTRVSKNRKLDDSQHRSAEPPVPTVRPPCAGQGPHQTDPSFQLSSYLPSPQHAFPGNAPISPSSDSRPPNAAPSPSPYSPVAPFHGPRHGACRPDSGLSPSPTAGYDVCDNPDYRLPANYTALRPSRHTDGDGPSRIDISPSVQPPFLSTQSVGQVRPSHWPALLSLRVEDPRALGLHTSQSSLASPVAHSGPPYPFQPSYAASHRPPLHVREHDAYPRTGRLAVPADDPGRRVPALSCIYSLGAASSQPSPTSPACAPGLHEAGDATATLDDGSGRKCLAPLQTLQRAHPYRREQVDDETLRALGPHMA